MEGSVFAAYSDFNCNIGGLTAIVAATPDNFFQSQLGQRRGDAVPSGTMLRAALFILFGSSHTRERGPRKRASRLATAVWLRWIPVFAGMTSLF
jgi:hypothetical protein